MYDIIAVAKTYVRAYRFGIIMLLSFLCEYHPIVRGMHQDKTKISEDSFWLVTLVSFGGFALLSFRSAAVQV